MSVANPMRVAKCPLCGGANTVAMKPLPIEAIAAHWQAVGYHVRDAFSWPETIEKCICLDCDLRFFSPQVVGGPDLYAALGRTNIYYGPAKWEFIEVLRRLAQRPRGGSLLEYGCGRGWFLEQSARFFDSAVGLDFNTAAVADCRARGLDVRAIELESIDQRFDTIVSFQVVEHVANPGETLRRLVQMLQPDGTLIIAVPNEDSLLGELNLNFLNLPPHHASCWSRKALASIGNIFGLQLEDYLCEPVNEALYLAAVHERLDRQLSGRSALMRPLLWFLRRLALAIAMVNFDSVRSAMIGHTHIAIFRKPALGGEL